MNEAIYSTNELRNVVIEKEVLQNENPNKILHIVEKIFDFNNQQRGKWFRILTPKQMIQILPIALAKV